MTHIRYGITIALLIGAYLLGYSKAETEGELSIEQLKLARVQAVIDAQNKVKVQYEDQIKNLNAALADVRSDSADRLRQLEKFRGASRDMETCTRERNELQDWRSEVKNYSSELTRILERSSNDKITK